MSVEEVTKSAGRERGDGRNRSGGARDGGDAVECFMRRFEKIDKAIHRIVPRILVLVVVVSFLIADIIAVIRFLLQT